MAKYLFYQFTKSFPKNVKLLSLEPIPDMGFLLMHFSDRPAKRTGETREQRGGSQEREREKRERVRDKENSFRVITK